MEKYDGLNTVYSKLHISRILLLGAHFCYKKGDPNLPVRVIPLRKISYLATNI